MLGYRSQCYGTYAPTTIQNEDGTTTTECVGSMAILENGVCKDLIKQDFVGFWEKVLANSGVLSFFGIKSEAEDECKMKPQAEVTQATTIKLTMLKK